jgi:type II secretory pathway pseudopilin PulG
MALINTSIPNLLNGVSKQPASTRTNTQCEEQINAYPNPSSGLEKRPPTEFITNSLGSILDGTNTLDTSTHIINRDSEEQYMVTIHPTAAGTGALSVYDLNNKTTKTVYYDTDAIPYLQAATPEKSFSFTTAGDVTFILNKEKTTAMLADITPVVNHGAMVVIQQAAHNSNYYVEIDGVTATVTTQELDADGQTDNIAARMVEALRGTATDVYFDDTFAGGVGNDITGGTVVNWQSSGGYESYSQMTIAVNAASSGLVGDAAFTEVGRAVVFTGATSSPIKYLVEGANAMFPKTVRVGDTFYIDTTTLSGLGDSGTITLRQSSSSDSPKICIYSTTGYLGTGAGSIKSSIYTSVDIPGFDFEQKGSIVHVTKNDGTDFSISARDSVADTFIGAFKDTTQYFTDLPASAPNGFQIQVIGDVESDLDDYFVTFTTRLGEPFGEGTWEESVASDITYKPDYSTLPHLLIRQADGNFLFKPADENLHPINATVGYTPAVIETVPNVKVSVETLATDDTIVFKDVPQGTKVEKGDRIYYTLSAVEYTVAAGAEESEGEITLKLTTALLGVIVVDQLFDIRLVDKYDYTFDQRRVGDETTNPDPSFIGSKINDIFFHENRLGLLSGENVILSETGEFFNFFRTTTIDLLDTAPIDLTASAGEVATLRHGVSFKGNLILFANQTQYTLGAGQQALTPKTVTLKQSSYYECDPDSKPVVVGNSIYFSYSRGQYVGMKEMVLKNAEASIYEAFDITDHIPQYIRNSSRMCAVMPQESLLIQLTTATAGVMQEVYLYKYLDQGGKRIQSAWFKFSLDLIGGTVDEKQVIGVHVINNVIYFVCQYRDIDGSSVHVDGFTYIYSMTIESGLTDDDSAFITLLDSRVSYNGGNGTGDNAVTATYAPGINNTTFQLPFRWTASDGMVAITKAWADDEGTATLSTTEVPAAGWLIMQGDHRLSHIWFGTPYTMTYTFSKPVIRQRTESGGLAATALGRYQVQSCNLLFDDTYTFDAAVVTGGRGSYSYTHLTSATDIGVTVQGDIPLSSDVMRIPIHSKADSFSLTITQDSVFPVKLLSAEYESQYNTRSRRSS